MKNDGVDEFIEKHNRRRRRWEAVQHALQVAVGVAIALALGAWFLMNLDTAVACEDKHCPAGMEPSVVRSAWSKAWECTCVFK